MKKQYLIPILALLLIGIAWGAGELARTDKTMSDLSLAQITAITTASGQKAVNPTASAIICNGEICKSKIYLANVIQTEWTTKQYVCYDKDCSVKIEYTDKELEEMRDSYVTQRLKEYADSIISETAKSSSVKVGEGTLTYEGK